MERRQFMLAGGLAVAGSLVFESWRPAFAAVAGPGPYGALGAADINGIQLPAGFTSRVIARTGAPTGRSAYAWHSAPDGGACYPVVGGAWVYVSNSEVASGGGGASAVRFLADGTVDDAYRILAGTTRNCAGGPTPWGTWLSCEENGSVGRVYECNPQQAGQGVMRPALGSFNHEAVAVDPATGDLYLTEDDPAGRLYRFVPTVQGDLTAGTLYAASLTGTAVSWVPTSASSPNRESSTTAFNGGEGLWYANGSVFFTTKGDRRVWELVPATNRLTVFHDCVAQPGALDAVDNITVHAGSGDMYVAEDGGNMELCVLGLVAGVRQVAAFCRVTNQGGSEITGPAFSPDGTRLYFSSQRGSDGTTGVTYEVTGPFRTDVGGPAPSTTVLPIADDTYVRGGTYSANTYGWSNVLSLKTEANPTYTTWSYLNVDLSSISAPVTSAVLRLRGRLSTAPATPSQVLGVSDVGWSGATMTWTTRPTATEVLGTMTVTSTTLAWYEVDVTSWVAARRAAGATKVAFCLRQAQTASTFVLVNSREAATDRPELVVTTGPTTPPPNTAPSAAFVSQAAGLTVTLDGTSSADADGTIAAYAWNFGDGATGSGPSTSHAYAAAGSYAVTLTVTDDDGATGAVTKSVAVTAPVPNTAPSAAFVSQAAGLTVTLDGTSSADADGTIAAYAWNFGDGATGSGPSTSHAYAAAGSYAVTLTVTDDDGATGAVTQSLTVTAPPSGQVAAADTFTRTSSSSFGAADTGGPWTIAGTAANYSVAGGQGRMTLTTPGSSRSATLAAVSIRDVDSVIDMVLDKPGSGSGTYAATVVRKVGTTEYRLRVRVQAASTSRELMRVVNGVETILVSQTVPGVLYSPGTVIHLRLRAVGSGTTTLDGKVWFGTEPEPATWQVHATHTTAALQQPGGVGIQCYVSGSSTSTPIVLSVDNLSARPGTLN